MAHPLRLGIKLSQDASIGAYRDVWRVADEGRFDHCWAMDHLASIGGVGDDRPIFDGWELLGAMAAATTHVRIGLMVTGITYRNPALLAKIATTVDHLSDGRLEFGIGAAWAANEHEMYGISGLDHRVGLFSEGMQVIRSLWTEERTTFEGRYFTMRDAVANPKPVQHPHPPIWVGSGGPRMLRLTARHADVWNPSGPTTRELGGAIEAGRELEDACAALGRDPAEIRRSAQFGVGEDAAELIDRVRRYHDAGFSEIIFMLTGGTVTGGGDPVRTADWLAERVLPELRG